MINPCIQCGKPRVDGKTWKEKSGISFITYTLTICPDPVCQKQVDDIAAERKAKGERLVQAKLDAKLAREKLVIAAS